MRIFYKPKDAWVGDVIPHWADGHRVYFLADGRAGGTYGEQTTWRLLETDDFVHFVERGVAIDHGSETAADRNAYTGSVIQGRDGDFHAFYTGHNPNIATNGIPLQVILHATSRDGREWIKDHAFVLPSDDVLYEVHDWRDPFVFWSEEERRYVMLVTARRKGGTARGGGCLATLHSDDLVRWEYGSPLVHPGTYVTLECPDYFRIGDWHYLVYSTFSDRFVTHYRKSRAMRGPYLSSKVDTFDGRGCYAIKTAGQGADRVAFGWVPSKVGSNDYGEWEWGGSMVVHQLWQDAAGDLHVKLPATIERAFSLERSVPPDRTDGPQSRWHHGKLHLLRADGQAQSVLGELPQQALIEATFSNWASARTFGLAFRCDDTLDRGYFITFDPAFNRITFDMWPRRVPGEFQWQIAGDRPQMIELERPLQFDREAELRVKLLIEDDLFTLNVNDAVSMTGRCYNFPAGKLGFFARDGAVTVSRIRTRITP